MRPILTAGRPEGEKIMKIEVEVYDPEELLNCTWQGGRQTVKEVLAAGKGAELLEHLESFASCGEVVSDYELNEYLWFDHSRVLAELHIEAEFDVHFDTGTWSTVTFKNGSFYANGEKIGENQYCDDAEAAQLMFDYFEELGNRVEKIFSCCTGEVIFLRSDLFC